ncbi:MAG: peroxiredoxin-like family protein [Candidatus Hydrogenedentota bacterium]
MLSKYRHCRPNQSVIGALAMMLAVLTTSAAAAGAQAQERADSTKELPSLQDKLDEQREAFTQQAPPEMRATFAQGIDQVAQSGVIDSALKEGDRAPDFTLPADNGDTVTLHEALEAGPVVLVWYRGGWCPYCNIALQALDDALPRIQEAGGSLLAISPETLPNAEKTGEEGAFEFPILSDEDNRVARKYGIVYTLPDPVAQAFKGSVDLEKFNGNNKNELPLAVTYVVDSDRTIRYAFIEADYKKRAEPAEIVGALGDLKKD